MNTKKILSTAPNPTFIIIRLLVGTVFLSEGIQKFLYPELRGSHRFDDLGVFLPELTGPLVGILEILCGILILIGLTTRIASVVTAIIMVFAIFYTQLPVLTEDGFWFMANRIRTDWSMLLGSIFLIVNGSGLYGLDHKLCERLR
ncbi:DoxX family protein [Cytophagaceae bacterium ABcell3]|nr:DoxX family protein [Cytophagaceae bacterium ABcell3]